MSKAPADSPAVVVVDAASIAQDLPIFESLTKAKTQRAAPRLSPRMCKRTLIMDPDHFVFKLKFEEPDAFLELIVSHLTRFLDLPGRDLDDMRTSAKNEIKICASKSSKKQWGFKKKKDTKGVVFGVPLTDESLVQVQNLTEFLASHLEVEGLFRKPGNSNRLSQLRAALDTGVCVDLKSSKFYSHDVASILKTYLGELPEPLLLHKYFKAHLQIAEIMTFDAAGRITQLPDKARRVEALQLLLLLLPTVNRTLLRGILNLLYQTAKNQKANKMNASNLATMFCPHLLWPRNLRTSDLQNNIGKLNDHLAFMIQHSQAIFVAPQYIQDAAKAKFTGSSSATTEQYQSIIFSPSGAVKRKSSGRIEYAAEVSSYTDKALKELFEQVNSMPNSAKKKKIMKNMEKQTITPVKNRRKRSRTFGGMIRRKVLSITSPNNNSGESSDSSSGREPPRHIAKLEGDTLERSRPVLTRRRSASSKNTHKPLKDSFFRRSIKTERKASAVTQTSDDSKRRASIKLHPMSPIPFPSLEKENVF